MESLTDHTGALHAAHAVILMARAMAPGADASRGRIGIAPPGEIVPDALARSRLAALAKPLACSVVADSGVPTIVCVPYSSEGRADPLGLARFFPPEEEVALLRKPGRNVLLVGGGERLLMPVRTLQRFTREYVMMGNYLWTVNKPSWRQRMKGVVTVLEIGEARVLVPAQIHGF